jgi:hypothetical protein
MGDEPFTESQKERDRRSAVIIEAMLGDHMHVLHTAEDGSPLTDIRSASLQTGKNKVIQKYSTFYCARIVRFFYMILYDLQHVAHSMRLSVPYLDELFFPFMNDDAYLLSRKTFPPRGQ